MPTAARRFICEHQVVPNLSLGLLRNIHTEVGGDARVLFSFSNIDEKCMYSVVVSPDRLSVERLFESLRLQYDSIMEVEVQGEGMSRFQDFRPMGEAA